MYTKGASHPSFASHICRFELLPMENTSEVTVAGEVGANQQETLQVLVQND